MASRRNVPRESSERKLSSASIHNSFHKEVDIYIYICHDDNEKSFEKFYYRFN